jgi:hypothetical protein
MRLRPLGTATLAAAALLLAAWTAGPTAAVAAPSTPSAVASGSTATAPAATTATPAVAGSVHFRPPAGTRVPVDPDCWLRWIPDKTGENVNAHISSYLLHRYGFRAVKVNAQVKCRRVSMHVHIDVTLWKTGAIFPHKVAGPESVNKAKGNLVKNQRTWKKCKNRTRSTYYGTSFASVVFRGVTYSASLQTPKRVPLDCGT